MKGKPTPVGSSGKPLIDDRLVTVDPETRAADGLPLSFQGALAELHAASGKDVQDLEQFGARGWLRTGRLPSARSLPKVQALEQWLGAPPGVLQGRMKHRALEHHAGTSDGLPPDFRNALIVLLHRKGMPIEDLAKKTTNSVRTWISGADRSPSLKSLPMVAKIEKIVGAPVGALTSRLHRVARARPKSRRVKLFDALQPTDPTVLLEDGLPAGFGQAIRALYKGRGKPHKAFLEECGGTAVNWMSGKQAPTVKMRARIEAVERFFDAPAGSLVARAFPPPLADPTTADGLPSDCAAALKVLMQKTGVDTLALQRVSRIAYLWYQGYVTPTTRGKHIAEKLETLFKVAPGTLTSRLHVMSADAAESELSASYTASVGELTYEALLDDFLTANTKISGAHGGNYRSTLSAWCESEAKGASNLIGPEFADLGFDGALARFEKVYSVGRSKKTVLNTLAMLNQLQGHYRRICANQDLPESFRDALYAGIRKKGISVRQVMRDMQGTEVRSWIMGTTTPEARNLTKVTEIEEYLDLPLGSLTSRLPRQPVPLLTVSSDDPIYAKNRYQQAVIAMPYRLAFDDWPESFKEFWALYVPHKKLSRHRIPGKKQPVTLRNFEFWHAERTVQANLDRLRSYLGFLRLPKPPPGILWEEMSWGERAMHGAGFKVEDIPLSVLFDDDLIFEYLNWARSRSFDKSAWLAEESRLRAIEAGMPVPPSVPLDQKTLAEQSAQFFHLCIGLVNRETSFARRNYEFMMRHFPAVPFEQWDAQCKSWYEKLYWIYPEIDKMLPPKPEGDSSERRGGLKVSRHEKLDVILRDDDPMGYLHDLIEMCEEHLPLPTRTSLRQAAIQNIAIFHLLVWMPLRGVNVVALDLDRHIFLEGERVRVRILGREFKSWIWGHPQDIDELMEDEAGKALKRWLLEYRPHVRGSAKTNAVFLTVKRKPTSGVAKRMARQTLTRSVVSDTKRFLGLSVEPHDFRPIAVSSAMRRGKGPQAIKAILNTSIKNAIENYNSHKNRDERGHLNEMYREGRARSKDRAAARRNLKKGAA